MIIKKFKALISKALPKQFKEEKVECAVDDEIVTCEEMDNPPYIGVPAPPYLEEDYWFDPPVITTKGFDYMEQEFKIKQQEREENFSVESDNIHQEMYEIATKTQSTTLHLNPIGGSENFQGGSENIHK